MGEGLLLKRWDVTVDGNGSAHIDAASRGQALATAWRSDVFLGMSFGEFLKRSRCNRGHEPAEFGADITVEGKPAFFIERTKSSVRIAYPGQRIVLTAHPYDVLPERFRPEAYRSQVAA